jgi:hypothetical protein
MDTLGGMDGGQGGQMVQDVAHVGTAVETRQSRVRAALHRCSEPDEMWLNHQHGATKHRQTRWFWLSAEGGAVQLHWGQHRDRSEQFEWKRLRYVEPKQRTVTGVDDDAKEIAMACRGYLRALMFRIRAVGGESVLVTAASASQKAKWVSTLRIALREAAAASPEPELPTVPMDTVSELPHAPLMACSEHPPPVADSTGQLCVVCWSQQRTAQLCHGNGTSHQCVCSHCADHLTARGDSCPMCRQPVVLVVKRVYR